ncbi:MAG: hypothetical protein RJA02_245 [Armatimonadota bacterium]
MPVIISANFQEVTNKTPAFQMIIRDVSRQWRVPAELVSAMLAMPSTELQTSSQNQSVQDVAQRLAIAWNRAPIIGNGNLEDGIGIFESWYFALGRAGTGKDGPSANTYADKVLGILAAGNHPLQVKINVTRIRPDQLTWGRNVYGPPAPWHFTDIPRRAKGKAVVDIPLPLMQQVWDAPDGFDGSGSCGPVSILMLLAGLGKITEEPVKVTESYEHTSRYGGLLQSIDDRITEPNLGTVHYKMLKYIRGYFPTASMVYGKKVTKERVLAELKAGRPVLLGTRVTAAGHLMTVRGYTDDGRIIVNDPAGDQTRAARVGRPDGSFSPTGNRYWNGGGDGAQYDWETLNVRWALFVGPRVPDADEPEDKP